MKTKTIKLTCLQIAFLFVSCGLDAQQQVTLTGFSNADTAIERYRGGFKFVGTNEKLRYLPFLTACTYYSCSCRMAQT